MFDANFRTNSEYAKILQDFLEKIVIRYNLKAPDIVVLSMALGIIGTDPIRKNTKIPETAEALIQDAIERGRDAFKTLAKRMQVVGKSRRHNYKTPIITH